MIDALPSDGEKRPAALVLPVLDEALTAAWNTLLDLAERCPRDWTLVGGQAVHLHCWERGAPAHRPTTDADVVLDVRAWPSAAKDFTAALHDLGFTPVGITWTGRQHRWQSGSAQVDVLVPRFLGERAQERLSAGGAPLLATPGAQTVLRRVEPLPVVLDGRRGWVPRPTLLGVVLGKAAAYAEIVDDRDRSRHLIDIATLATLAVAADLRGLRGATMTERSRLATALKALDLDPRLALTVPGADEGLSRLRLALASTGPSNGSSQN